MSGLEVDSAEGSWVLWLSLPFSSSDVSSLSTQQVCISKVVYNEAGSFIVVTVGEDSERFPISTGSLCQWLRSFRGILVERAPDSLCLVPRTLVLHRLQNAFWSMSVI